MAVRMRCLLAVSMVLGLLAARPALAQKYQPFGPVWDEFGHDFAIFAPAEVSEFDGGPPPNEGFFLTYDRLYWNVNRPSSSPNSTEGDFTWGNRWTTGYMTPQNYGWLLEVLHVDGPNAGFLRPTILDPRLGSYLNVAKFNSVELSHQWRFKPLHHGSVVELFVGGRYSKFEQWTLAEPNEHVISDEPEIYTQNNMIGPQIGLRWYKQKGRWVISTEGRYYYAYNHQIFGGLDDFSEDNWVPAGDLRAEATFELTKAFALHVGGEMLYLGRGVARSSPPYDDQDVLMAGVTFGISINR